MAAKAEGFTDVVYLDAKTDSKLEELSAANIFIVKVRTPFFL
jgi:branched-chain amino acid aminotransferase